ncbi:S8 family serine peptidase [Zhihengliuella sp.]|uniref:S8 family serine peptidase n=1 Tax=Zhihengliuella sp. TaxID=1954483 RepID=UPI0028112CA3|nr:S8 family serine peptidase [Zhihengliuella sp.]
MYLPNEPFSVSVNPGRFVVVFDSDDADVLTTGAPDYLTRQGFSTEQYFPRLGIAVVEGEPGRMTAFQTESVDQRRSVAVVPELSYHVLDGGRRRAQPRRAAIGACPPAPAAAGASESAPAARPGVPGFAAPGADPLRPASAAAPTSFADTDELTWGLQAVRAVESGYTGAGIRVAVLDTGFDLGHPDFAGRQVTAESFVSGEDAQDGHGHGTHCIGTACGPRDPDSGRGYGVASGAEIYAGKVLGNAGSGSDATILAGIEWALQNDCQVVSMSLGADVQQVHPPYVTAGRRALEQGSLIVAAAGNNARRSGGNPGFVGTPANSPYVLAVGAVDANLGIAEFSARTLDGRGGQVDLAGPGVDVYSSWPMPERYNTISGTSMATPHVAGVAALLAEATGFRGRELWAELVQEAQRLQLPSVDVGSGLVLSPPPAQD